jgi:hypothetical protein
MEIDTKNRRDLKSYFIRNAMPTESNFADFIDGVLNQRDDGIVKQSGHPLSIQAEGTNAKVLNLYENLSNTTPAWTLSLNPRLNRTPSSPARAGLGISDSEENLRLFIHHSSGNVGIGTNDPAAKLDITLGANDNTNNVLRLQKGTANYLTILNDGKVGIGVASPSAELEVRGNTKLRGGTTTIVGRLEIDGNHQVQFTEVTPSTGLRLVLSNGQGIGVDRNTLFSTAGSHSWRDSSNRERMLLSTAENGGLTISGTGLSSFAGNLGLGITNPKAKLHIDISARDSTTNPLRADKGEINYLTMLNNGNIGIGTATPDAKLHVAGEGDMNVDLIVDGR